MGGERFRSWLFSPADAADRCLKALASPADQVIWDLEDGVAEERKDAARKALGELLVRAATGPRRPWVRLNPLSGRRGQDDLWFVLDRVPQKRRRIVVPKADSKVLESLTPRPEGTEWLLLVESADGLVDLMQEGLDAWRDTSDIHLAFGALDYQLDVGGQTGPDEAELATPRALVVLAARRRRLGASVDGIWEAARDAEGVLHSARRARRVGFGGKLAIHPAQVAPIHEAFAPTTQEVAWARQVLEEVSKGAALVAGKMVDRPVFERARRIVEDAEGGDGRRDESVKRWLQTSGSPGSGGRSEPSLPIFRRPIGASWTSVAPTRRRLPTG